MYASTDLPGIAAVVAAVAGLVTAFGTPVVIVWLNRVKKEVRTMNALTLGQSSDATETRRVADIPHDDRTRAEQEHLDGAPSADPPQGPAR